MVEEADPVWVYCVSVVLDVERAPVNKASA